MISTQTIAIIGAKNEEQTVSNLMRQMKRAGISTAVLVCNGCTDNTLESAQKTAQDLHLELATVSCSTALGHDVPRAIGTYYAKRNYPDGMYIYLDADWQGSFGPMLKEFVRHAQKTDTQICSITYRETNPKSHTAPAAMAWRRVLEQQSVIPKDAAPYLLPMAVKSDVFNTLSPLWLAEPGKWVSSVILHTVPWSTFPDWDTALIGHVTRSALHGQAISKRIMSDASLALDILNRTKPQPEEKIPALPERNLSLLHKYASELMVQL